MKTYLSKNSWLIFIALVVGLLYSLPHIYFINNPTPNHVYIPLSSSELLYGAQVREILEGHLGVGDPQFIEHKYIFPSAFAYLPVFILAIFSTLTNSITSGFAVSDFIIPALLFITLTGFINTIIKNCIFSMFASLSVLVLYPLTTKIPPLTSVLLQGLLDKLFLLNLQQPLPFYRTPNPQISYLIIIIALWLLFRTWQKGSFKLSALTSILGILLFTTYFYSAMFFFFVVGFLVSMSVISKDQLRLKYTSLIFTVLLITALSYKFLFAGTTYESLDTTFGVFYSRHIEWILSARYGLIIIAVFIFRKVIQKRLFLFLLALLLAAIASMNFQLFTGWTAQPAHWPQTTIEPIVVIIIFIIAFQYFKKRVKTSWAIIGISLILFYGFMYQLRFIQTHPKVWQIPQDLSLVYKYIDSNAELSTVVSSLDSNVLTYIPVLTKANIFIPIESYHYASVDEIWDRVFYNFKIYGFTTLPLKHVSISSLFELTYNVNKYKHFPLNEYSDEIGTRISKCYPPLCSTVYSLPSSVISEANNKFESIKLDENPYKLHFALYTPYERSIGGLPPEGKLVYSSGSYDVYQVESSLINK